MEEAIEPVVKIAYRVVLQARPRSSQKNAVAFSVRERGICGKQRTPQRRGADCRMEDIRTFAVTPEEAHSDPRLEVSEIFFGVNIGC